MDVFTGLLVRHSHSLFSRHLEQRECVRARRTKQGSQFDYQQYGSVLKVEKTDVDPRRPPVTTEATRFALAEIGTIQ